MDNKRNKKYSIRIVLGIIVCLLIIGGSTFYVDPVLHYREANENMAYPFWPDMDRYLNNGIIRNCDYDAIITGTSMTQNFKVSEFDDFFNVNAVKVSFANGSYKEVNDNIIKALEYNPNVKIILRSFDLIKLLDDADYMWEEIDYPTYLYDDNPFNDVNYLLNKSILVGYTMDVINRTIKGEHSISFDEYSNWNDDFEYGKTAVDKIYDRPGKNPETTYLTEEAWEAMAHSIDQNYLKTARDNPDVEFYYFIAPYSIYFFDQQNQYGLLPMWLEAQKRATQMLLELDNIHVFSFFDNTDMICNMDNYMDIHHYSEDINSDILKWISNGEYELTQGNYEEYYDKLWEFFMTYDYEGLFRE